MSTRDFRNVDKGEKIYQYRVQLACRLVNQSQEVKERMASIDGASEDIAKIKCVKLRVAKQPQQPAHNTLWTTNNVYQHG